MEVVFSEYPHGHQPLTSLWNLCWSLCPLPPSSDAGWVLLATSLGFLPSASSPGWVLWTAYQLRKGVWQQQWFLWIFSVFCPLSRQGCMALWGLVDPPWPRLWRGFLMHVKLYSFTTPSPTWGTSSHPKIICLFLSLYPLSYLVLRRLTCLFGGFRCSAVVQKLFCRSCSKFWRIFDILVGRQVISPTYSCAIFFHLVNVSFGKYTIVI